MERMGILRIIKICGLKLLGFICAIKLQVVEIEIAIGLYFSTIFNLLDLFSFHAMLILQLIS